MSIFSSKCQRSRSQDVKPPKSGVSWRAAAPADQARQAPTAHYAYAIVRPSLLSAPMTLGNGTDGRKCRCRRRYLLLYIRFIITKYDLAAINQRIYTGWSKNVSHQVFVITSSNIHRFSKTFHWHVLSRKFIIESLMILKHVATLRCGVFLSEVN